MIQFTSRRKTLCAAAMLFLTPILILGKGTEIRMRTALAGGAIAGLVPSGQADFRAIESQGRTRLNVEVEDVNLVGSKVDVFVDGEKIGSITISAAPIRGGELELNSQDGQLVPAVKSGALVVVRNGATAILSGVLK